MFLLYKNLNISV